MSNNEFNIFISTLTRSYEKDIVHLLLNKGYQVSLYEPIDEKPNIPSVRIALIVALSDKQLQALNSQNTSTEVYKDVIDILYGLQAKCYSVVVAQCISSCFGGCNFSFTESQEK
jgi:hypothetical protein